MHFPAWADRHPWLLALGVCLVAGAVAGWLAGSPPTLSANPADEAAWNLPDKAILDRYHAANFQKLVRSAAWQAPPNARVAGAAPGQRSGGQGAASSWKLAGIVTGAGAWALVVPGDGGKTLRLKAGDRLPNGTVIKHVDKNAIEIQSANCVERMPLFPLPGAAKAPSCPHAADGNVARKALGETHE